LLGLECSDSEEDVACLRLLSDRKHEPVFRFRCLMRSKALPSVSTTSGMFPYSCSASDRETWATCTVSVILLQIDMGHTVGPLSNRYWFRQLIPRVGTRSS
jgi:hypothetical protein